MLRHAAGVLRPAKTCCFEFSKKRDGGYINAAGTASDH